MKSAATLRNPPEAEKKKKKKMHWALNVLHAEYAWGYKWTGKERRQNYWGNNSDLLAFDIDRTLKIDGQLKAAVIYTTVFWLPGNLTRLDWIKRISVNLPRRLILEMSGPWRSLVTARRGGIRHLRMEKHEVPNGAQKVKPIFVADKSWAKMNWLVRRVVNPKLASLVRLQKSWRITRKLFNS